MKKILLIGMTLALMVMTSPVWSSPSDKTGFGIRSDGHIDQNAIAKAYTESEWESVVESLTGYLRKERHTEIDRNERVFAFKYLGVILSADSTQRAKAESYFTRLLELSPNVEILDLLPSNRVTEFFAKVKSDFEKRKQYTQSYDVYGNATDSSAGDAVTQTANQPHKEEAMVPHSATLHSTKEFSAPKPKKKPQSLKQNQGSKWIWWTVGLTAVVGGGVGVYYLANQPPPKKVNENLVDPQ